MLEFTILQAVYKNDNPQFLTECLQSIFESSFLPKEIIIVKDGYISDDLQKVIVYWKEKLPIKMVGYDKNEGLAFALNYGIQFIKTEYVARMDSDDICYKDRFEKQIKYLMDNPHILILGSGINEFYEQVKGIYRNIRLFPKEISKYSKKLYKGTPLGHPTLILKTDLLKKYLYNTTTKCNEDIDLWFRLLKDGYTIYNLQEPLIHYRITDNTFARRGWKKSVNEMKIYYSHLNDINKFSFFNVFIFFRFISRLFPKKIIRLMYLSNLRKYLIE